MSRLSVSRRSVVSGLASLCAGPAILSSAAMARTPDGPPIFETARRQFTIVRPAKVAPAMSLMRLDGVTIDFARLRGKVVLVNFWATWCPACRAELPALDRLQAAMGGADFEVAAISTDREGASLVTPFLRRLNIRRLPVYLDPAGQIGQANGDGAPFRIYGMPISYLVGPAGHIEGYFAGEADWSSDAAKALVSYYIGARRQ